ncbi:diguanylate cyclase [Neorhizobium lilium]|uniref:diguanylate cyclase n=1 Tax=Neorhizobium lilium TaxID=2503024 RepID=A0A444LI26_9HYPH|nr:diguanylate cyclase [Neorhizobium lilium]RWX78712.1 diguanylate cyclase [Neorhizobium lilium]
MPTRILRILRRSLTLKIFTLCFVCVHMPLIAVIAYLGSGFGAEPMPLLFLLLIATVAGTGLCFLGLWWLIRPLKELASAVETYQANGGSLNLAARSEDEIGTVTAAVSTMVTRMDGAVRRLHHQATTDALTGLGNRRWLSERVDDELARASRQAEPLSVVLFDLDLFKAINDSHGHHVGDQVLVAVAQLVRTHLRRYDLAARIGGEEFCVVLPRTRRADALMIAERLRKAFAALEMLPLPPGSVTASFGIYEAAPGDALQHILSMADKALYDAKRTGRNRIADAAQLASDR